tara:strand:+ start:41635 stop:42483 length:849 start_codon:yes stop_codon:yes gene_type:complete
MNTKINNFIKNALLEDIGNEDITSIACIDKKSDGTAQLITKENCFIAGINFAKQIYQFYDKKIKFNPIKLDGEYVKSKSTIFTIHGNTHSILATERLVLNCMQRMSGIATKTNQFIEKVKDLDTVILDTRKTCPNMRFLDKKSVELGGGTNHRNRLDDFIMIKDNHIDFSGGIEKAIKSCQHYIKKTKKKIKVVIEARNINEVNQIIKYGFVDRILLDNFNIVETRKAVEKINKKFEIESSGNININNVRDYALCGVDFISIGSLTHSIKNVDLSMIYLKSN